MDNFSKILKILFFFYLLYQAIFVVIPHHLPIQPAGSGSPVSVIVMPVISKISRTKMRLRIIHPFCNRNAV